MKVWDRARIELSTPGSAVRIASVARHATDCAKRPGILSVVSLLVGFLMPHQNVMLSFKENSGKMHDWSLSTVLVSK